MMGSAPQAINLIQTLELFQFRGAAGASELPNLEPKKLIRIKTSMP